METQDYILILSFLGFLGFLAFLAIKQPQSYVATPSYVQVPPSLARA